MRVRPWLIVGMISALVVVGRLWRPHPKVRVEDWPTTTASADSVSRMLTRVIGAPPEALVGCGRRVQIRYVDAPIDIRPEINEKSDGSTAWYHSVAQQTRYPIAQVVATIAWSAVGRWSGIDTITVTLIRGRHRPAGYSYNETDFSFIPDSNPNRPPRHQFIGSERRPCGRMILALPEVSGETP